jgi:hypothetical protein
MKKEEEEEKSSSKRRSGMGWWCLEDGREVPDGGEVEGVQLLRTVEHGILGVVVLPRENLRQVRLCSSG